MLILAILLGWEGWLAGDRGGIEADSGSNGIDRRWKQNHRAASRKALKNLECGKGLNMSGELLFFYKNSCF